MRAMILNKTFDLSKTDSPLELTDWPKPEPKGNEVLLRVSRCGVCHTELDEIEGRAEPEFFPIIPGHEVVGHVEKSGPQASRCKKGDRVGVAWIYSACGECKQCRNGNENLCNNFRGTGWNAHGGYAEYMVVPETFTHPIPEAFSDAEAAPLLCAGAVGYRSLRLTNLQNGNNLGLIGFGASNHLVLKIAKHQYPDSKIFVFARNPDERKFATDLGAEWAGDITDLSPEKLDALIDTTPVWKPVVEGLKNLDSAGRLVINAIRKENIDIKYLQNIDYPLHLWKEKEIKSVANVQRKDVRDFLEAASEIPIKPSFEEFQLEDANKALMEIKNSKIRGAKILKLK
jgi:propanol-preferring alcohol dehydrogenase